MCPVELAGALAVLLLPGWMVAYCELDAAVSVDRFHMDPTCAHSASSQNDWACAVVEKANRTSDQIIVGRNTATGMFMNPPQCCPAHRAGSARWARLRSTGARSGTS